MPNKANKQFNWPIVGHANIVSYLVNSLESGNIGHAYVFYGPSNVGKTTVAKLFANSLVCRNLHESDTLVPCGECDCCRQIAANIHPDVFWLEREIKEKTGKLSKNISIEQVRELQEMLNLHSFLNTHKVALISGASALSSEAANSLLKTLEEPAPKTLLILIADSLSSLPKTIASRCQLIKFRPVATKEIFDSLLGKKIDRKKAKFVATAAMGRPGIALNFVDDPEAYLDFQDQIRNFIALLKGGTNERFKLVGQLAEVNEIDGIKQTIRIWRRIFRDLLLIRSGAKNYVSNLFLLSELESLSANYGIEDLLNLIKETDTASRYLDANVNPRLILENLTLTF